MMDRIAQKNRESYLDMRNAHKIAQQKSTNEYMEVYKETFEKLSAEFESRFEGQLRKRSKNVWQS